MASLSPKWDNRNQGFISPAQLHLWKRDQELQQQQPRMNTNTGEFGQNTTPSPPQMSEMRHRTISGQSQSQPPPPASISHARTTSAFSLFGRKSHTMDAQKNTPPPPSSFHKQSASIADFPKPPNVLTRRSSNPPPATNPASPNNGHSQQEPLKSPPSAQLQSPTTPSSPGSSESRPQLHPEIRSIVQLTASHAQKVYFSGPMVHKLERQADGQKPAKDEGWRNVWGQLGGTTLSLWDMKEIEEASKQGRQVPPSYVNVTDAFVQVIGTLTTPGTPEAPSQSYGNVFSINTAGVNLLLFSCPNTPALLSWTAALRLAGWEKSRLEEMYTAHLIRIMLNDGRKAPTPLVRCRMEGWVRIRVAGQTDWKKLWMVISAGGVLHDNGSMSSADNRPTSPAAPRKNRISQLFSRDQSPQRAAVPSKPALQVFASPKPKDRKKALLTFRDVAQAFAVYPERPELISRSTLMKLEGVFGDEEMVGSMRNREAWMLVMPELEENNTRASEMLKWLIGMHDAFELYGRPAMYSWDPRDPQSMMFAYPIGSNREHLFLDRELAEGLDPRDDRTSYVRRQMQQILWERMRGSSTEKAQPPIPHDQPPTLPTLPVMHEESEQPVASTSQLALQSPSGAPQLSMHLPPMDFGLAPENSSEQPPKDTRQPSDEPAAIRALTPITEKSNPQESRSMSGDTNPLSQRPSLQYSSQGPAPHYSPPAPASPQKSPEALHEEQDSVYGGILTSSPIPNSPPADGRGFGFRPSEEPHFVVASRPTSKQGQYGSPKPPSVVLSSVDPANVQLPLSPQMEQQVPVAVATSLQGAAPQPQFQQQQQKTPSPTPVSPKPVSPKPVSPSPPSSFHVSPTSFSPPPPVHSPRSSSPSASMLTSPHSIRDSLLTSPHSIRDSFYQPSTPPRFSALYSPHSPPSTALQSFMAQQSTSTDALPSPVISHAENPPPPPSPARSSLASSSLPPTITRRESRDESPPEEAVIGKEAGALYYMRHVDGDAPPPAGLRRPPPPPASDDDEEDESSDSPSIYTPSATNSVNPLNIRKSPSPPPMPSSKASSMVYPRRSTPRLDKAMSSKGVSPSTSPILGGSRPPETISRFGSVAKPSGARAAPVNKLSGAGLPSLANTKQPSSFQQQRRPPPPTDPFEFDEDEDYDDNRHMAAQIQNEHSELSYEDDRPVAYDDTADALAALNFLEQEDVPAVPQQESLGWSEPSQPSVPRVVEPPPEPLSQTTIQNTQQRSSFAPSRQAAERKAKSQAQQAAHQAAVHKPGRANGKGKGKTREAGAWGESSDEEEEEEEEEDDEEADSDEELPPRHRAQQQNTGAPNAPQPRLGYPSAQSMQSMQMPQLGPGQDMGAYGQGRRPRDLPQLPGQMQPGAADDYMNQPQSRRMMQDPYSDRRSLYPNEVPRRQASPLSQMTRPLSENPQYQQQMAAPPPRQNMWSQVLEPGSKVQPQRETFVQLEPPSQTMTKAFTPHGLLSAGLQDKEDRSAKRQEELARETGASLINVPNKPPPPQTGLLGAVAAHEREKKREGGLGATLTEREREKRLAEERQRKLDDYQRMQLDQMQQGGSMYGGMGMQQYPGFNPMMNPMMANPMMMGMNPIMTGAGWGGYPGMMNPQQMFAAQQAAQAYSQAMMAFSTAGSQVGAEGAGPAPLNPMMTGGSMFDPRFSMMGMMNPMGMAPGMGGGMSPGMGPGMSPGMGPGMNPMGMGGMGMQMTGGAPFDSRFSAGFEGGSGTGTPAQNSSVNGRGSPAVPKAADSTEDLPPRRITNGGPSVQ